MDEALVDHLLDDLAHLRDGHGAGEGHHHLAVGVLGHGHHDLEGLPERPPREGGVAHAPQERGERSDLVEIEALERDQLVLAPVVKVTLLHAANLTARRDVCRCPTARLVPGASPGTSLRGPIPSVPARSNPLPPLPSPQADIQAGAWRGGVASGRPGTDWSRATTCWDRLQKAAERAEGGDLCV